MASRTLTIRGLPDQTLRRIRSAAASNHRSLNGELLAILERVNEHPEQVPAAVNRAKAVKRAAMPPRRPAEVNVDRDALARLCRRFHISRLAMFGSVARGDSNPDSDVDLLVDFEPGLTPGLGIVSVSDALRPLFGGRYVDLVTRRGLRPALRDRILAGAVPLYGY